jgi:hypothetical protein
MSQELAESLRQRIAAHTGATAGGQKTIALLRTTRDGQAAPLSLPRQVDGDGRREKGRRKQVRRCACLLSIRVLPFIMNKLCIELIPYYFL